jgi:hypothetical protein
MKLKHGQYVRHPRYGWGTVLERDDSQTMVYFHTVGVKKFTVSQAVFEVFEHKPAKKKGSR